MLTAVIYGKESKRINMKCPNNTIVYGQWK